MEEVMAYLLTLRGCRAEQRRKVRYVLGGVYVTERELTTCIENQGRGHVTPGRQNERGQRPAGGHCCAEAEPGRSSAQGDLWLRAARRDQAQVRLSIWSVERPTAREGAG